MFKLTVSFETIAALTTFVNKMGADVQGGTISHDQMIAAEKAPSKKSSKAKKVAEVEEEVVIPATPANVTQAPATPFPSAAPVNFAPGATNFAAPAQPVAQPVAPTTPAVAQPAPSAPAMAMPQAPIAAPVVETVSPDRQKWNDACVALVNHLQTHGGAKGLGEEQLAQVIANSFVEAGLPAQSKISKITDAQVQAFYPVLYKNVEAALR